MTQCYYEHCSCPKCKQDNILEFYRWTKYEEKVKCEKCGKEMTRQEWLKHQTSEVKIG